jgi:co-chaperonin GroES (HSP10)
MKIQPVEFKVMVRPDKVEEQSAGGIWAPTESVDKQQFSVDRGEVIAFGAGFFSELPGPVPQVGDKVLFDRYGGTLFDVWEDIPEGDETRYELQVKATKRKVTYRLLNDKDICAIMEE